MAFMNAHALNAQSAYGNSGRAAGSDKDVEVHTFQKSIARLRPLAGPDFKLTPTAAETLSENLRLWDALTVDVLHPENGLSDALSGQLLSLSRFVRNHTHALYSSTDGSTVTVDVLIDINTAILKGLLGQPGDAAQAA